MNQRITPKILAFLAGPPGILNISITAYKYDVKIFKFQAYHISA